MFAVVPYQDCRALSHPLPAQFYSVSHKQEKYGSETIVHGDKTIVVVKQGSIGFAMDKGCPVLLPPGLHQWQSDTMHYVKQYDLNNNVIRMGPFTLVRLRRSRRRRRRAAPPSRQHLTFSRSPSTRATLPSPRTTAARRSWTADRRTSSTTGTGNSRSSSP